MIILPFTQDIKTNERLRTRPTMMYTDERHINIVVITLIFNTGTEIDTM